MKIKEVMEINEDESSFTFMYKMTLKWNDPRLKFNFLKKVQEKNLIKPKTLHKIWTPKVKFVELKGESYSINEKITIKKQKKPKVTFYKDTVNETYSGADNEIHMETISRSTFICPFHKIQLYPFGDQKCSLRLFLHGLDDLSILIPDGLVNDAEFKVGQFLLESWEMINNTFDNGSNGVVLGLSLKRDLKSIILVMYMPTFFLFL